MTIKRERNNKLRKTKSTAAGLEWKESKTMLPATTRLIPALSEMTAPSKTEARSMAEKAMDDFLAGGGKIQKVGGPCL